MRVRAVLVGRAEQLAGRPRSTIANTCRRPRADVDVAVRATSRARVVRTVPPASSSAALRSGARATVSALRAEERRDRRPVGERELARRARAGAARARTGSSGSITAASAGRSNSSSGCCDEVLVERVVLRDEHGERLGARAGPPARPAATSTRACPGSRSSTAASSEPMSIPSSSAFVAATATQLAVGELPLDLAAVLGEVAGAVATSPASRAWASGSPRRVNSASSSAARRDRVNPIVRAPSFDEAGHHGRGFGRARSAARRSPRRSPVGSTARRASGRAGEASRVDHLDAQAREARRRAPPGCRRWRVARHQRGSPP